MNRICSQFCWLLVVSIFVARSATGLSETPRVQDRRPQIQMALLLDTSNSMDGLIEQAKSELWRVVNSLNGARLRGQKPELHVALYEYGNNGLSASSGHIRCVAPLTDDLDRISAELFSLRTNGGNEYCGQVIGRAVADLLWSDRNTDLKLIVIAGNEPFTQGEVDYRQSCSAAVGKGVLINTIHCGSGIPADWRDGAVLAEGRAMNIDHDRKVMHIDAPQDAEIARLGVDLNKTYLPFGAMGAWKCASQSAQDSNAANQSRVSAVERAVTKANAFYCNSTWDLVDAVREKKVDLANLKPEELPESMRTMSFAAQKAHIELQGTIRVEIQTKINKLQVAREAFLTAKQSESSRDGEQTLDAAMVAAVRAQAESKGFSFVTNRR